jgi:hypothetical protein
VVEHSIGNGEVDSSILSGSTIFSQKSFEISAKLHLRLIVGFGYVERNRPRMRVSTDTRPAQWFAFCPAAK